MEREQRVIIKPRRTGNGGTRYLARAAVGWLRLRTISVRAVHYRSQSGFRLRDMLPKGNSLRRIKVALKVRTAAGLALPR